MTALTELKEQFETKMDQSFELSKEYAADVKLADLDDSKDFINEQLLKLDSAISDGHRSLIERTAAHLPGRVGDMLLKMKGDTKKIQNEGKDLVTISEEIVDAFTRKRDKLIRRVTGIINTREHMQSLVEELGELVETSGGIDKETLSQGELFILSNLEAQVLGTLKTIESNITKIDSTVTIAGVLTNNMTSLIPRARNLLVDGLSITAAVTEIKDMGDMLATTTVMLSEINKKNQEYIEDAVGATMKALDNTDMSKELTLICDSQNKFDGRLIQSMQKLTKDNLETTDKLNKIVRNKLTYTEFTAIEQKVS